MIQHTVIVRTRIMPFIIRAEVEFLQRGPQPREHAADPQQQAKIPKDTIPPILLRFRSYTQKDENIILHFPFNIIPLYPMLINIM